MPNHAFSVGLVLSVEAYYKTHQPTHLLGWEDPSFLMTKAIYLQGQPSKLKTGDPCKVRFLKEGVAYGFSSEVISVQFYPFSLMFLKYPSTIECLKIRVSPRFKTDLPARFADKSGRTIASDAVVLDISEGGCGLKVPVQKGGELSPDETYTVYFRIMDRELGLEASIRKIDRKGDYAYFLGLEFTAYPVGQKEALALFIDFLAKHAAV